MEEPLDLAAATTAAISAWRVEDGYLVLVVAGAARSLRCACGRQHWIVETRTEGGRLVLGVRCHGCGRRGELRLGAGSA